MWISQWINAQFIRLSDNEKLMQECVNRINKITNHSDKIPFAILRTYYLEGEGSPLYGLDLQDNRRTRDLFKKKGVQVIISEADKACQTYLKVGLNQAKKGDQPTIKDEEDFKVFSIQELINLKMAVEEGKQLRLEVVNNNGKTTTISSSDPSIQAILKSII